MVMKKLKPKNFYSVKSLLHPSLLEGCKSLELQRMRKHLVSFFRSEHTSKHPRIFLVNLHPFNK
jgi:hypothetical protein